MGLLGGVRVFRMGREMREAFRAAQWEGFVRRLLEHLRRAHGMETAELDDGALDARVRVGLRVAQGYGLTWESSLAAFVSLMFAVGPEFYKQPAIHEVLTGGRESPDYRVRRLRERITPEQWREAAGGERNTGEVVTNGAAVLMGAQEEFPNSASEDVVPCLGWISVRLVNDRGEPYDRVAFVAELPDRTEEGTLTSSGTSHFRNVPCGTATYSFPEFLESIATWEPPPVPSDF